MNKQSNEIKYYPNGTIIDFTKSIIILQFLIIE